MDEKYIYTFIQPTTRGGYYYIAVLATNEAEAYSIAEGIALTYKTGSVKHLSKLGINELVVSAGFRGRLERFGYAHRFVKTWPPPYSARMGHYGFIPQ